MYRGPPILAKELCLIPFLRLIFLWHYPSPFHRRSKSILSSTGTKVIGCLRIGPTLLRLFLEGSMIGLPRLAPSSNSVSVSKRRIPSAFSCSSSFFSNSKQEL